jgi:kilA, N-terminal/APSES-type HTH DNA-binding domain protein
MKKSIDVQGYQVGLKGINKENYISLTDIARYKNADAPADVVKNWMRSRATIDFLGLWEELNNPNVNVVEIDQFKNQAGSNAFTMSPKKWIDATNAIGIYSSSGKYSGGTYAHQDIAFEFASWVSAEFKLYLIKEFQRLKVAEQQELEWTSKRELAKVNYRIHTDAIKENLIVPTLNERQISYVYASEADVLNVALFGKTAAEWREENPDKKGNIRDYATVEQLLVVANMESYNAILIAQGLPQAERLKLLNTMADSQLRVLLTSPKRLK